MTDDVLLRCDEPVGPTGFCDICGRKHSAVTRQAGATTSMVTSSTTTATGKRTFDGDPGGAAEFALLPPLEVRDPAGALLDDPHYPEHRQFCGNPACHHPVGRGGAGQPALTHGFCGRCGLPFDFSPKLNAGDRVDDRYNVVGWLAHGGLGWVYLAKDTALGGIYVAIKGVLNPTDAQARDLAAVERDVLIRLQHANIVRIGNFVSHPNLRGGKPDDYIVMDYVSGLTLRQVLQQGAELTVTHVITYGRAILAALDYLHREGLLYCDMKPDNVIHGVRGITVVDLGAARVIGDTKSKHIGTKGYQVDPGELKEHGLTVRSDLHTVGRTLQELLAASKEPPGSPGISFGVDSLSRLLARATSGFHQRFASVAEMSEQLDGVRREILSLQGKGPLPAPSQRFDSTPELLDSGLGVIPGLDRWTTDDPAANVFSDGLPSPREAALRLPVPWAGPDEAAALFLDTAGAGNPRRLLDKLVTFGRQSVDVEFARVRAYLELDDLPKAVSAIGVAEQLLGTAASTDWRVQWHYGLLALAKGNPERAVNAFDRVYSSLPGEDAPKLALGFCYEHLGPATAEQSRRCYEAVWLRDHAQASAAFGLARLRLRGVRPEDRKAAADILDGVRPVSRHYDAAKIAVVRIYVASLPCGPPGAAEFAEAARRLPELYLDSGDANGEFRERLTTVVCEAEFGWAASRGERNPVKQRLDLERCFRSLARRARTSDEHGLLVDRANSVRPKTFI